MFFLYEMDVKFFSEVFFSFHKKYEQKWKINCEDNFFLIKGQYSQTYDGMYHKSGGYFL